MAVLSASCPGTLARQALHVADDAMLPQLWGWRATQANHEAAGRRRPRTSDYSRLGCHLGRRGAARPTVSAAPCRATHARPTAEKNQYAGIERSVRRRDASARAVGGRLHPPAAETP